MTRSSIAALLVGAAICVLGCASAGPSWHHDPPDGCAVGYSGATLHPGDALRQARRDAYQNLLIRTQGTRVREETRDVGGEIHSWAHQESRGRLREIRIVALYAETGTGDPFTQRGEVYALACPADAPAESVPAPDYPSWVLDPPHRAGRICAPAVAGPTLEPDDQEGAAIRDGQQALAEAIESDVHQVLVDDERSAPRFWGETRPTDAARARAAEQGALEDRWLDEDGRGPMGVPGTLYGLLCSSR